MLAGRLKRIVFDTGRQVEKLETPCGAFRTLACACRPRPAKEAEAVYAAFSDNSSATVRAGELLNALEPTVPQFMIWCAHSEVLVLDPVVRFFPNRDVDGLAKIRKVEGWSRLDLLRGSTSAVHLNQLSLFDPGECDVSDDLHVRGVLRDWLSIPLHLAQFFGLRRHYPLVFSLAAFMHQMHRELKFAREVPFPELLRSMFRDALHSQT